MPKLEEKIDLDTKDDISINRYSHLILYFPDIEKKITREQTIATKNKDEKLVDIDITYIPEKRKPICQAILFYDGYIVELKMRSMIKHIDYRSNLRKFLKVFGELPSLISEIDFDENDSSEEEE